jgi:hypothetical protein
MLCVMEVAEVLELVLVRGKQKQAVLKLLVRPTAHLVPHPGLEPGPLAPEANALSSELMGHSLNPTINTSIPQENLNLFGAHFFMVCSLMNH